MIRIAIVEDEDIFARDLETLLTAYSKEKKIDFSCVHFKDASKFLSEYKADFDIVFMDIIMPAMNGLKAAAELRKADKNILLVFITNMHQYAIKGYAVDALDYIIKPLSPLAVNTVMDKAVSKISAETEQTVTIKTKGGIRRTYLSAIRYVEVSRHSMTFHTSNGKIDSWGSINAVEKILPADKFARCNNCYLVSLSHVRSVEGDDVIIADDRLKIARTRKKEFLASLARFLGEKGGGNYNV